MLTYLVELNSSICNRPRKFRIISFFIIKFIFYLGAYISNKASNMLATSCILGLISMISGPMWYSARCPNNSDTADYIMTGEGRVNMVSGPL